MAKIDREDLPEWFKLEKYRTCKSFSAAEWFKQLSYRKQILHFHPKHSKHIDADNYERSLLFWKEGATKMANQLWVSPIQRIERATVMIIRGQGGRPPIRHGDLVFRYNDKQPIKAATMKDFEHSDNSRPVITIDLSATNQLLKDEFEKWLKEARTKQNSTPTGRKKMYDRWAGYGLLPYLDLHIWEIVTGNSIIKRVMPDAVGYTKGERAFSRTVISLANSLMRDLSELEALAAAEDDAQAQSSPETFET